MKKAALMAMIFMILLLITAKSEEGVKHGLGFGAKDFGERITIGGPMAVVMNDGEVRIDWTIVERIGRDPNYWNKTSLAYARLMLAIRDGTWKVERSYKTKIVGPIYDEDFGDHPEAPRLAREAAEDAGVKYGGKFFPR